ncbi:hypothetical protein EHM69_03840 [candidate division KSB1 bacterium]|nr:MAG: hypothetical protein EHM69_03840 [candidate division KSB1 bacterium]
MNRRAWAWLIIIVGMIVSRAGFLEDVVYNIDEAEYAVAADALDQGWLPGVDLLGTTKPPGIVLFFKLLFLIFGRSLTVIHAAHILLMIAAGMLVVELAIALWDRSAAIPAAMLFWMVANSFNIPHEIIALNVESPGIVCIAAALCLVWSKPNNRNALIGAGVLLGLATIFRQSFLAFALPTAAAIWFRFTDRVRGIILAFAGFVFIWLPILIWYGAKGGLGWAWDSWIRYPMTYAADTGWSGFLQALYLNSADFCLQVFVPVIMALGGVVLLWKERHTPRAQFLFLLGIASFAALCSGSRFFGHYWIQTFSVLALWGIPAWFAFARSSLAKKWILGAALFIGCAVALLHFPTWRYWDDYAPPRGISFFALGKEQEELAVGAFAREHTKPDETIAVWGYCPQIYYHAHRLPGVRDFLCHYITGFSPGTFSPFEERARRAFGHPRAQQMFIEDLERREPKYVFDLVQIDNYTFTFFNYSLRTYPELADYLRQNYLPEGEIGRVPVYRRRTPEDQWWPTKQDIE